MLVRATRDDAGNRGAGSWSKHNPSEMKKLVNLGLEAIL